MPQLPGILRVEDATLLTQVPETDTTSAVNAMLEAYERNRNEAFALLVDEQTTARQEVVKTAGLIRAQRLNRDGRPLEERVGAEYEVAYEWHRFGYALGWDREAYAYMTVADLDRNVIGVTAGNFEDHKVEAFRAIFTNTNHPFTDEQGSLTIRALANQDGTLYALPTGATAEANHYIVSNFTAATMSDTNNPFALLRAKLRVFAPTARVVALVNELQLPQIQAGITAFIDVPVAGISSGFGDQVATPFGDAAVPGTFVGVDGGTGVHVYTSNHVPADYMIALVIGAPAPLKRRVPQPVILQGFSLEAEETHDPFYKRHYRDRFGYAAANRLGMAVLQLKASGTYDVPTEYVL